ncbi:ABC transporter ATP-binding protein [Phenylobacterium sp.]|uniref:ABC transporter ATP-binding protein n=1 Tax=Phenylobacterium sp. TaxID=1871053 RepID=UPI002F42B5D0
MSEAFVRDKTAPKLTWREFARGIAVMVKLGFAAAPGRASAAMAAELVGAGLTLFSSYQLKDLVQAAAGGDHAHALTAGLVLAITGGMSWIAFLTYGQLAPRVTEAIAVHLDTELVRLTTRMPTLEYADRPAYADKITLIRNANQALAQGMQAIGLIIRVGVMLGGTFVILIGIDPWLAVLPLFAIPRAWAGRKARQLAVAAQENNVQPMRLRAHIFAQATSPAAGKEIRIFGLGQELADRYRKSTDLTRDLNIRSTWGGALWSAGGDAIFTLGCVGAIAWLVVRASTGAVSPGGVVLAATLATGLIMQMTQALQFTQVVQMLMTTAERFLWLVDYSDESAKAAAGEAAPPAVLARGLRVEHVSFTYPDRDKPVLDDVSLELPAGSVIALVGENGSGKSTLVKLLCGFYRPDSGAILADGEDVAGIDPKQWRARTSGAFQDFSNLEVVLHESVGVGDLPRLGDRELATAAMGRAGAADLAKMEPKGLDTLLGKKWGGVELSGGQWQKLALSRALTREAPLLSVFDEPAAALDASAEHDMFERFAAEARSGAAAGRATLLVSHRFSTVRMADAIAVLDGGKIVEFGPHEALMAAGGKYAELFEMQARAYR